MLTAENWNKEKTLQEMLANTQAENLTKCQQITG